MTFFQKQFNWKWSFLYSCLISGISFQKPPPNNQTWYLIQPAKLPTVIKMPIVQVSPRIVFNLPVLKMVPDAKTGRENSQQLVSIIDVIIFRLAGLGSSSSSSSSVEDDVSTFWLKCTPACSGTRTRSSMTLTFSDQDKAELLWNFGDGLVAPGVFLNSARRDFLIKFRTPRRCWRWRKVAVRQLKSNLSNETAPP